VYHDFRGGDRLRFGNAVIAMVSLVLLGLILDAFLMVGFVPMNNDSLAAMLAALIAFLVSSLVVGYVFALKIQENSRIRAIGIIDVLSTFTILIFELIWTCNVYGSEWFQEDFNNMFKPSNWRPYEYAAYTALYVSILAIFAFVVIFIGLYVGSMLRKPSARTKE
jgi:ABC-type multidrug transport system permease subunit